VKSADLVTHRGDLRVVAGDILMRPSDGIVNVIRHGVAVRKVAELSGFARTLCKSAGQEVVAELGRFGALPPGAAVATGAGRLPASWVIHVAALDPDGAVSERSLFTGVSGALRVATMLGARSVAFPLLGAGAGKLTPDSALRVLVSAWVLAPKTPEHTSVVVLLERLALRLRAEWGFGLAGQAATLPPDGNNRAARERCRPETSGRGGEDAGTSPRHPGRSSWRGGRDGRRPQAEEGSAARSGWC